MAKQTRQMKRIRLVVGLVILVLISLGLIDAELLQPSPTPQAESPVSSTPAPHAPTTDTDSSPKAEHDTDQALGLTVSRVIDGDTIELSNGDTVRYIGVDTPETRHPRKGLECFGKEATAFNKEIVLGKPVRLEQDVSATDRFGRILAYVFVPTNQPDEDVSNSIDASAESELQTDPGEPTDEIFVNALLVEEGYAVASSYPPDVAYDSLFAQLEAEARQEERGLWSACR